MNETFSILLSVFVSTVFIIAIMVAKFLYNRIADDDIRDELENAERTIEQTNAGIDNAQESVERIKESINESTNTTERIAGTVNDIESTIKTNERIFEKIKKQRIVD